MYSLGGGTASTFRICGIGIKRNEDATTSSEFQDGLMIRHGASNEGLTFELHWWEGAVLVFDDAATASSVLMLLVNKNVPD